MSLEVRLRIAIAALIALVVIGMSALYLYDFTRLTFSAASDRAGQVADQVKGNLLVRLDRQSAAHGLHPTSSEGWKKAWTELIQTDPNVTEIFQRSLPSPAPVVAV